MTAVVEPAAYVDLTDAARDYLQIESQRDEALVKLERIRLMCERYCDWNTSDSDPAGVLATDVLDVLEGGTELNE